MNKLNKSEFHSVFINIKNGKEDAIKELYEKYGQLVVNISFSILKDKETAEDISQMVFLKIMQLPKEKLPEKNELSWLYTVTKNQTLEYLRKQNKNIDVDLIYEITDENSQIDNIIEKDVFNNIICSLDEKEQEIVTLKILSNYTFSEIGKMLDMPTGTVQWKYYKSLHTLKLLVGNVSMFMITFILYILLANKENTDKKVKVKNEIKYNKFTLYDVAPSGDLGSSISKPIFNFQSGLLCFSGIFLIFSIIFGIIFAKHQQKRKKKTSK